MSNDSGNPNLSVIYNKLDKLDDKFDKKIDKVDSRLDRVDKELAIYNEQLKYHIEGVRQLKVANEIMKNYIDVEMTKLETQFAPVAEHVSDMKKFWSNVKKIAQIASYIVSFIATVAGIVYTIGQL